MIVAASPSSHFRPESSSSPVLPSSHNFPAPATKACHHLHLLCKEPLNVFNHIQPLFSVFVGTNPLFSTPSGLFFATSTLCFHHFMNSFAQKHPG